METTDKPLRIISGLGEEEPRSIGGRDARPTAPAVQLDPRTYKRALDCVHCGLCLPACPTYAENGLEADSPRGRIVLMKGLADGKIEASDGVRHHLDLCLDCRACETACPSGVVYHELIEETRARLGESQSPRGIDRLMRAIFFHLLPQPKRLKLALLPARLLQKVGLWKPLERTGLFRFLLPTKLAKMQQMLPERGPLWERSLAAFYPSTAAHQEGPPKRIAFFAGCIGSVLFQEVNRQSIALLQRAGCDVYVPDAQGCCGAIHLHGGDEAAAAAMARRNIDALSAIDGQPVDAVVTNIAGCGAQLKDYTHLLRDDAAYAERAAQFVDKMSDICELLVTLEMAPPEHRIDQTVTYHDACHLVHAQRIAAAPRQLLAMIPGLTVEPLGESQMCCGAAGTYNLSQPEMASDLGQRKVGHIRKTGATVCVTGNVGCAMQIASEARQADLKLEVVHPVTLLYEACFGGR